MKVSIVISIYQSHEALKRQIRYFTKMNLPDDVEFIFVDDGSNPPLKGEMKNLTIVRREDNLAWTQGLGRNLGARKAIGDYILFTDIDHILSRAAIDAVIDFKGYKMVFPRYLGILTEDGNFTQDRATLFDYGLDPHKATRGGKPLYASIHGNTFAIRRKDFYELGGYNDRISRIGYHPGAGHNADDKDFLHRWNRWAYEHKILPDVGPDIYMFPVGSFHKDLSNNPKGLFHDLSYETGKKLYKC